MINERRVAKNDSVADKRGRGSQLNPVELSFKKGIPFRKQFWKEDACSFVSIMACTPEEAVSKLSFRNDFL